MPSVARLCSARGCFYGTHTCTKWERENCQHLCRMNFPFQGLCHSTKIFIHIFMCVWTLFFTVIFIGKQKFSQFVGIPCALFVRISLQRFYRQSEGKMNHTFHIQNGLLGAISFECSTKTQCISTFPQNTKDLPTNQHFPQHRLDDFTLKWMELRSIVKPPQS